MDILFHQLHIAGESSLRFAQDDLKFFLFCSLDHPIKVRAKTVRAGVILITVELIDVPAPLYGIVNQ